MKRLFQAFICISVAFGSCTPEHPDNQEFVKTEGVFVLNEGNFTYGNASLSFFDLAANQLENQVFFRANGFPLGDIACSMTLTDSLAYICVNYSGKVVIINTTTFTHEGTIAGLTSPRFLLLLDEEKAYVSDLYAEELTIINPKNQTVTGSINTGCSTEQMIRWKEDVLVLNWSFGNQLLKIDVQKDSVTDSLTVRYQPNSMVVDHLDRLWILSDGGYPGSPAGNEIPALTLVSVDEMKVLEIIEFPDINDSPNHLQINQTGDTLYFLSSGWSGQGSMEPGIYRMPVSSHTLPTEAWIAQQKNNFYSMGIDPENSTVYVSDAKDYLQNGWIYRYSASGSLIDSLEADRIPGFFAFKTKK